VVKNQRCNNNSNDINRKIDRTDTDVDNNNNNNNNNAGQLLLIAIL